MARSAESLIVEVEPPLLCHAKHEQGSGGDAATVAAWSVALSRPPPQRTHMRKELFTIASVEKFRASSVQQELRHNLREIRHSSNPDIDPERSHLNDYSLTPDHGGSTPFEYYKERLSELYIHAPSRKDLNTAFGWIVTLPQEVTEPEQEERFFEAVAEFLLERYHPENSVAITVHRDEGGQPHLHYIGIPAVENNMIGPEHPQTEKLCCKEVINREELRHFHPDLQKYLDEHGIDAQVHTGITGGQNRTVSELKRDTLRELRDEVDRLQDIEKKYNELLQEREQERETNRWDDSRDIERGRF